MATQLKDNGKYPVFSANVFEPFGRIDESLLSDFSMPSILWGIDGDWMVNVIPANESFYPTDHCGVVRVKSDDVLPKVLAHFLLKAGERIGFDRNHRAAMDRVKALSFIVPPLVEQKSAVAEVEKYEAMIAKAEARLQKFADRKRALILKCLNE